MSYTVRGSRTRTTASTSTSYHLEEDQGTLPPEPVQRLWLLVGVVGAGKTTLSSAIVDQIPNWSRVCQDEMGQRQKCEQWTREYLSQGKHVIVDRQNFDAVQRGHFVRLGTEFNVEMTAIVFTTPPDECRRRLVDRGSNHPTITTPELALSLHTSFSKQFQDVGAEEGFDRIFHLPPDLPRVLDVATVLRLIAQVDRAPKIPRVMSSSTSSPRGRGRGRGSRRGRGDGRGRGRAGDAHVNPPRAEPYPSRARPGGTQQTLPFTAVTRGSGSGSGSGTPSISSMTGGRRLGDTLPVVDDDSNTQQRTEEASMRTKMREAAEARIKRLEQSQEGQ